MYKIIGLSFMLLAPLFVVGQSALAAYYENKDVDGLKQYLSSNARPISDIDNDTLELVNEIYKTVLYNENSPFYLDFSTINDKSLFLHQNKIWLNICELRFLYEDKYFRQGDLRYFAADEDMEEEFDSWNLPDRVSFQMLKDKSRKFYRKILENQLGIIRDSGKKNVSINDFLPIVDPIANVDMISVSDSIWQEIFLFANGSSHVPPYNFSRSYREIKPESKEKYGFLSQGIANFVFHRQGEKNAPQLPMEIFLDSREDFAIIYLSHGAIQHHLFLRKLKGEWIVLENVFGYNP